MFRNLLRPFTPLVGRQQQQRRLVVKRTQKTIPVQPLSRSRRLTKHRGRGRAIAGRKPQDQRKRTQFFITDDIDAVNVARSLPPQKKARSRKKHSLSANVADNVAAPLT